ncbi:hypothetical protein B6N60_03928 [Richelia sinica FACHB-800]|uniref:Uncharacterized protein n=1 Tax=Richelia sinica FACHB-800 TaxID=1357546 RepID=A0A975Y6E6_9NOST|nr:hypothetical protein B6N60_03928 [Richelia sinica FACHB-800]
MWGNITIRFIAKPSVERSHQLVANALNPVVVLGIL